MGKVVVVGSINTDFCVHVNELPLPGQTRIGDGLFTAFGGKGANQAFAAARAGADVALVAAIGALDRGAEAIARYRETGIDATWITQKSGAPTGAALIITDSSLAQLDRRRSRRQRPAHAERYRPLPGLAFHRRRTPHRP